MSEATVNNIAESMGWQKNFSGEGAKTAEEFIKHGANIVKKQSGTIKEQTDRIKELKTETSKITSMMSDMQTKFNETVDRQNKKHEAELERKMENLNEQRDIAIDEADRTEVKRIDKQIKDVETQKAKADNSTDSNVTKEQEYFNKWYVDKKAWLTPGSPAEKEMNKAIALFRIEESGNANTIVDVEKELKAAEEHLKAKYPENFGLKPDEKPPGGAVGEGKSNVKAAGKDLTLKNLEPEEMREYKEYERIMGKNFNPKAMLKNFAHMRESRS